MKNGMFAEKAISLCLVAGLLISCTLGMGVSAKKKPVLNCKKLVLSVGQKKKIKVKNTAKKVKWISADKKIASVNKQGVVCGKKEGKTKITALIQKKKLTCQVIVKKIKYVQNTAMPERSLYPASPAPTIVSDAVISSSAPTAVATFVPTETPAIEQGAEWETGKQSGKKEDFKKYFNPEMKQYTKKQQGVPLGTIEEMTYPSEVVGVDREAYVYLPPEYDSSKKYPVLYLLHGIGCDRGQWRYMSLNEMLSNMIYMGELQPIVAVIPSIVPKDGLNKDTFSAENIEAFTKFEDEFIKDLEPYVLANYGVSSKREDTGVCGLSMGGMEALRLGFAIKDHFNYIGSFSAAPTLDTGILTLDGWKTKPQTVLLCTGDADGTVGSNPSNYEAKLAENNVDHMWYLYPGGKHEEKVWRNGLVNFLKRSYK